MYGAGNIGRGFIGQIFAQSGCELTFIELDNALVEALNRECRYPVRIVSESDAKDIWIEGIKAINGANKEAAADAIIEADIIATAVGTRALPHIAAVIAAGLQKKFKQNRKPLNIIICENLIDADTQFAGLIADHLSPEEKIAFDECTGMVRASIGRMVPIQTAEMQDGNPLRVCTESYNVLPVDKNAFKGEIPALLGMIPFDNFDFYIKRKLFIHNMGHGIFAYMGTIRGDTFISESVNNEGIRFLAHNAMKESALALSSKFQISLPDIHSYIDDLLARFSNRALKDTCARVGMDTERKLGSKDRLIGAFRCCIEEHIKPVYISTGIAAALYCCLNEKGIPQSRYAAESALKEISLLEGKEIENIILFYTLISTSF